MMSVQLLRWCKDCLTAIMNANSGHNRLPEACFQKLKLDLKTGV